MKQYVVLKVGASFSQRWSNKEYKYTIFNSILPNFTFDWSISFSCWKRSMISLISANWITVTIAEYSWSWILTDRLRIGNITLETSPMQKEFEMQFKNRWHKREKTKNITKRVKFERLWTIIIFSKAFSFKAIEYSLLSCLRWEY